MPSPETAAAEFAFLTGGARMELMRAMRRCGWKLKEIGVAFGISHQAVSQSIKDREISQRLREARWDALRARVQEHLQHA